MQEVVSVLSLSLLLLCFSIFAGVIPGCCCCFCSAGQLASIAVTKIRWCMNIYRRFKIFLEIVFKGSMWISYPHASGHSHYLYGPFL